MTRVLFLVLLLAAESAAASPAEWIIADGADGQRRQQIDATGSLDPAWLGASVWYGVPVLPYGLLTTINDSLSLETGGHLMLLVGAAAAATRAWASCRWWGPRWSFHLTPTWTAFWTVKLGYEVVLRGTHGIVGDGSLGATWHMSPDLHLRVEAGAQGLLRAGIGMTL